MKRADQRKFHYIYKITRHDGKYYIGMHSTDDLDDGYFGSGQLLWKSIKKHGKEKHAKEILEFLPSRLELKMRERQLVNEETLDDPFCMNLKLGGEGGGKFWSKAHMQKFCSAGGTTTNKTYWTSELRSKNLKAQYAAGTRKNVDAFRKAGTIAATSESAMIKRKATFAKMGHAVGKNNSQFGSCWVTNGKDTIKIKHEQLEKYLLSGYRRGRTQP